MPKKISFADQVVRLEEVKSAMRDTKDKRLYERYQCIHLLLMGESQKNIAKMVNRGADAIGDYVQAYCASGLPGLQLHPPPGRPNRLSIKKNPSVR